MRINSHVGNLKTFSTEIAGLFVSCFSKLPMQAPILATVLAVIQKDDPEFAQLVVEHLLDALVVALQEGLFSFSLFEL